MGVRHMVLLTFPEGTTRERLDEVAAGLAELPARVPQIRSYRFGADVGLNPRNADLGLVAEFDSVEDFRAYVDHPAHRAFVARHLDGVERLALQMGT